MEPGLIGGLTPEQVQILGESFASGFFTVSLFSLLGIFNGAILNLIKRGI